MYKHLTDKIKLLIRVGIIHKENIEMYKLWKTPWSEYWPRNRNSNGLSLKKKKKKTKTKTKTKRKKKEKRKKTQIIRVTVPQLIWI
jgi:hypothetical protein